GGQSERARPRRTALLDVLHNPTFSGAYCDGRRPIVPRRKRPGCPGSGRTRVAAADCLVLLRDRCPAYISWDRYQANQRQIEANRARAASRGAIREGAALLGGLLVCGRCGYRMSAHYDGPDQRLHYLCGQRQVDYGGSLCQGLEGRGLDALVAQQVLEILEPAALELSLAAAGDIEAVRERLHRHWQQQRGRAGYEAERGARQDRAGQPEHALGAP